MWCGIQHHTTSSSFELNLNTIPSGHSITINWLALDAKTARCGRVRELKDKLAGNASVTTTVQHSIETVVLTGVRKTGWWR